MKRVVIIFLFAFLFAPLIVFAEEYDYNGAIERANNYINSFSTRSKYILNDGYFEFDENGAIKPNNAFVNGGLINKTEYEIGGRYLSPGAEYWTMTSVPDSANQYTISNILRSDRTSSSNLGVRVTEYVKPGVKITGNGTLAHPWEFLESYIVYIGSNDVTKGTISESEIHVEKGGNANFTINANLTQAYRFKTSTCGVSYNASTGAAVIRNVRNDINCLVIFDNQIYNFDLTDTRATTQASPSKIILEYRGDWYSDENLAHRVTSITPPKRTGYTFKGYKYNGTDIIDQNGNILRKAEPSSLTTLNYKLDAQWQAIQVTCNAGSYLPKQSVSCQPCTTGSYCSGGTFTFSETANQGLTTCPSGYTSAAGATAEDRCYISIGNGKYLATAKSTTQTACPAGTYKAAHTVYYGSTSACSNCGVGTYSTGGATSCTACPSGYTSDAKATAQNKCYINVGAGKYIGTAKSTTQTACPAGKYNPAHKVNYGSTSACGNCAVGTYSTGGAASCTACPSGYTSAAGATAQNKCYISVANGKYLGTAKGTTQTACPAGTYKAAHTVYYGSTSACSNCGAGTYSTGGATTCTSCPSGYTSSSGATAQNRCYLSVAAGRYLPTAKGTSVSTCPAGTYKAAHTVYYGNTSACSNCGVGQSSAAGSASCTTCAAGTYNDTAGSTCKTCPTGQYCTGGSARANCPAGTYGASSGLKASNQCTTCQAGYYCTGGTNKTSCPKGTYRSGTGGSAASHCTSCGSCKSTTATARTSASQCTWNTAGTYNTTTGGYVDRIGIASNGSCITNIKRWWGNYGDGYSYLWLSGNYGFEDYLASNNHGYCSSSPLATWGFERYILSAYNKMEFTDRACQYAPVYGHAPTRWDAQWLGSGTRNYSFPSYIYGENTVYFQLRMSGYGSNVTISGLKFNVNGSYFTLRQLVDNGYIEPLVLYGAADVYSNSVAINLYDGGSQGAGNYPDTFVLMTLKSGYNLRGFQVYQSVARSNNDGYYVRVIDPNWFRVVLK